MRNSPVVCLWCTESSPDRSVCKAIQSRTKAGRLFRSNNINTFLAALFFFVLFLFVFLSFFGPVLAAVWHREMLRLCFRSCNVILWGKMFVEMFVETERRSVFGRSVEFDVVVEKNVWRMIERERERNVCSANLWLNPISPLLPYHLNPTSKNWYNPSTVKDPIRHQELNLGRI